MKRKKRLKKQKMDGFYKRSRDAALLIENITLVKNKYIQSYESEILFYLC